MTSLEQTYWIRADVTLALKSDASSTKTVSFINAPALSVPSDGVYWPILNAINDIGTALGNFVPATMNSTFQIINAPGTFGWQRKFSDLLQRYIAIDQPVVIYYTATEAGDLSPTSWTQAFKGVVKSINENISDRQQILTFNIQSNIIDKLDVGYQIVDNGDVNYITAATNKTVPIVFGENVEVKPILVNGAEDANATFYYASTFSTDFKVGGINNYYMRDQVQDPDYQEVRMAAATSTNIFSRTITPDQGRFKRYAATKLVYTPGTDNYIITNVLMRFYGESLFYGSFNSEVFVEIWDRDASTDLPRSKLARAEVPKSEYADSSGWLINPSGYFYITFHLDKPVPLINSDGYYLAYGQGFDSEINGGAGDYVYWAAQTGQSETRLRYIVSSDVEGQSTRWQKSTTTTAFKVDYLIRGIAATETTGVAGDSDSGGWGYSKIALTHTAAAYSGQKRAELRNMDLVLNIDGMKDNGSGSITGSASSIITRADHAIKLLMYEFNGTNWVANTNKYSSTDHYSTFSIAFTSAAQYRRILAGSVTERQTLQQLIERILRNSAARIGLRSNGKLALWAWGSSQTVAAIIPQQDIVITAVRRLGTDFVLNRIKAFYNRIFTQTQVEIQAFQGQFADYSGRLDWTVGTNSLTDLLIGESQDLFGERLLQNGAFEFIQDSTSMENIANYYLSKFAFPAIEVDIDVPLNEYSDLELFDVIEVQHPALSSFYGAWPSVDPYTIGGETWNWKQGQYTTSAQTYRAQIEGRKIKLGFNNAPTLSLTLELLTNYPVDPT